MNDAYGEIKTRKNFYPANAEELVKKGKVSMLFVSCRLSDKTKNILKNGKITVYEGIPEDVVENVNKKLKEGKKNDGF